MNKHNLSTMLGFRVEKINKSLATLNVFVANEEVKEAVQVYLAYETATEFRDTKIAIFSDSHYYNNETFAVRATSDNKASIKRYNFNDFNTNRTFNMVVAETKAFDNKEFRKLILNSLTEYSNFSLIVVVENEEEYIKLMSDSIFNNFDKTLLPNKTFIKK